MYQTALCSFWKNFSGHFARLACNHSYGYAFRPIGQIDPLKFTQNSAFSCNMRAGPAKPAGKSGEVQSLSVFSALLTRE
jgi:hypothetical protein